MENCIFRLSKETAEWLAQQDLTETERRLVVKKIWEKTLTEYGRRQVVEKIMSNTKEIA